MSQAAFADLSIFDVLSGGYGSGSVSSDMATVSGISFLSGTVAGLSSFQYTFTDSTFDDGYAYFLTTAVGGATLSTSLAVAGDGDDGVTKTYDFATPFTGVIKFGVGSHDAAWW